jgi:hypothetical protein
VYVHSLGLSARTIDVAEPSRFELTDVTFLAGDQVSLALSGGLPDTTYNLLRATTLDAPLNSDAWVVVGTIRSGETWIDTDPPHPFAVYVAAEPAP